MHTLCKGRLFRTATTDQSELQQSAGGGAHEKVALRAPDIHRYGFKGHTCIDLHNAMQQSRIPSGKSRRGPPAFQ